MTDRSAPRVPEVGYADAVAELDAILTRLERDDLDVDVLAQQVQRASELIKVCRSRIARARTEVDRIVADLESFDLDAPDAPDAPEVGTGEPD